MRATRLAVVLLVAFLVLPAAAARAKCCVWRVTGADGKNVLYLAGSVHALRPSDYPLPGAYDRAFNESGEVVFETDPGASAARWGKLLDRAARLPEGTTLREHVDPRTYAYLQRVLARTKGTTNPEAKIANLRPWALGWLLEAPGRPGNISGQLGVDHTLETRARKAGKRVSGLVPLEEHVATFGGLSDRDGEILLLLGFIQLNTQGAEFTRNVAAWRRGDTDAIDRAMRADYGIAPALHARIITDRNRRWLPKVEGYLRGGGPTRLVVAGAAHMGGAEGLPALLQAAGYRVEQL